MRIFDMLKAGQDEYILSESINLIGMCYTSLGQKPDKKQMKGMANLLYQDIINYHTNLTLDEIRFAFDKGLRNAEQGTSAFVNVRTWSVWIKDYKDKAIEKRRQGRETEYQLHQQGQKALANTINKARQIK